jgi:hypothetical protein
MANNSVMILNNSCDLPDDRLDFVAAAPIIDFGEFLKFEQSRGRKQPSLDDFATSVRKNEKSELFYLPSFAGFHNGALVLLHLSCVVSAKLYQRLLATDHRVASFSQTGFYFMLIKLISHLARPESNDVTRPIVA